VLRSYVDRRIYCRVYQGVYCLQRGTIHRRQWRSWKVHNNIGEMVMAMVRIGEHVKTMGGQTAAVFFAEEIESVIVVIGIGIW
jgi:hypothetical protein